MRLSDRVTLPSMTVAANDIEISYQGFGNQDDPALLLLMGAGAQSIYWPEPLCRMLAAGGRYVIRYDHRDLGGSTWIQGGPNNWSELKGNPPYTLSDMAWDVLELISALGIRRAHLVGAWLGGVLTEVAADLAPERLLSATLIGATPPWPASYFDELWSTMEHDHRPLDLPVELIEQGMAIARASCGPAFPFEEVRLRTLWAEMVSRGNRPMARARHVSAGFFSPRPGPRSLADAKVPVLVLEGTAEKGYRGMAEYATHVPQASFVPIEGLGHELPSPAWSLIAEYVLRHTAPSAPAGVPT